MSADIVTKILVATVTGFDSVTTTLLGLPMDDKPEMDDFAEEDTDEAGFTEEEGAGEDDDTADVGVITDVEDITLVPEGQLEQETVWTITVVVGLGTGGLEDADEDDCTDEDDVGVITDVEEITVEPEGQLEHEMVLTMVVVVVGGLEGTGELGTVEMYVPPVVHGTVIVLLIVLSAETVVLTVTQALLTGVEETDEKDAVET